MLVPIVVPWGYVFKHYLKAPGDRWGKREETEGLPAVVPTNRHRVLLTVSATLRRLARSRAGTLSSPGPLYDLATRARGVKEANT